MPSSPVPQNNLVFSAFFKFEVKKSGPPQNNLEKGLLLPVIQNFVAPSKKKLM